MGVIMSLSMEIMGREVQIAAIKVAGPIMTGQNRKKKFVLLVDAGGGDYDIDVEDPDNDEAELRKVREVIVMAMRSGRSK